MNAIKLYVKSRFPNNNDESIYDYSAIEDETE
jgi:hypothetical protein